MPERELDKTKAFVILSYAETEEFIESCSLCLINSIEGFSTRLKPELRKGKPVVSSEFAGALKRCFGALLTNDSRKKDLLDVCSMKPVADVKVVARAFAYASSCLNAKRNEVSKNNGLNKADMSKLFDKLGFDTEANFIDLRNNLDILTTKRSRFAHTGLGYSVSAVTEQPDPINERNFVRRLSADISKFVAALDALPKLN